MVSNEQLFHQRVMARRVQLSESNQPHFVPRAVLYLNSASTWGKSLEIKDAPTKVYDADKKSAKDLVLPLCESEHFLDTIQANNIDLFEPNRTQSTVGLNEEWRAHVNTLVVHIRKKVQDAELDEALREGIFTAVERLQTEVDRNRTRLDAATEVWDKITDAIGKGAENLESAVKIVERVRKRLGTAQRAEIEALEQPQLPPPPPPQEDE